jgi:hypothetical protein
MKRVSRENNQWIKLIALLYFSIGAIEVLILDMRISIFMDSICENLDFITIFPSHFPGTILSYTIGSLVHSPDLFFILGQTLALLLTFYLINLLSASKSIGSRTQITDQSKNALE